MHTRRNLLLLGWVSLLTDASSHMVFPLLPFFLSQVLGAAPVLIGAIEGAAESLTAWLKGKAGSWSDRSRGRKPWVVTGYVVSTVAKLLFVVATSWALVLLARLSERIGKGLRGAPRDALIADTVPADQRGAAFGWQKGMDAAGGVLGALTAWALYETLVFPQIFLWSLLPAGLAVLLTLFLVEVPKEPVAASPSRPAAAPLSPAIRRALLCVALNTAGRLSFVFLLLGAAASPLGVRDALLLYAAYQLVYALLSSPLGRLADRLGRMPLLHAGTVLLVLAYVCLSLVPGSLGVILAFVFYAVGEAALDTTQRAWFADLAPKTERGRVLGAYHAVVAFVALPSGIVLGWLWGDAGVLAACGLAAALTLSGSAVLLLGGDRNRA